MSTIPDKIVAALDDWAFGHHPPSDDTSEALALMEACKSQGLVVVDWEQLAVALRHINFHTAHSPEVLASEIVKYFRETQ